MNKGFKYDFDSLEDYSEVKDIFIAEELTQEDVEEGLEPLELNFKVCFTHHSIKRMYGGDFKREVEMSDVLNVLMNKSAIIEQKMNSEFRVISDDREIAIPCKLKRIDENYVLIVKTVISNKVFKNGRIYNKKISNGQGLYVI